MTFENQSEPKSSVIRLQNGKNINLFFKGVTVAIIETEIRDIDRGNPPPDQIVIRVKVPSQAENIRVFVEELP